jgi:hypothetical protein
MAMQVVAKKVKKAEATASSRLWKKLNPANGKPRKVPPAGCGEVVDWGIGVCSILSGAFII